MTAETTKESLGTDEIMEILRSKLRSGALVPGQRLVEVDLVQAIGATRSRLREALRGLEFEGLVELQEFRGAVVRRISKADAFQMWQLREAIEGFAAKICAEKVDLPTVQNLVHLQQKMETAAENLSIPDFIATNDAYHALIIKTANNHYLSKTLQGLQVNVHRLESKLFYSAELMQQAVGEHRAITTAIVSADDVGAEAAMRRHISNNYAQLERLADHFFE